MACVPIRKKSFIRLLPFLLLALLAAAPAGAARVKVVVEGVGGDARDSVREAYAVPPDLAQDGSVDSALLEHFADEAKKDALRALEPFGYYDPAITHEIRTEDEATRLLVTVVSGKPVRVTRVNVAVRGKGSEEEKLTHLASDFPLKPGDVLLHQEYEKGKAALQRQAVELGYLDASYASHEIRIRKSAGEAEIDLVLETGPRYLFGAARLDGGGSYPQRFLRRYVAFREGEPFSYAKLGETQLNFANSERFRRVTISPEKEQASGDAVPLTISLETLPRRVLKPGVGYGTDTGPRVSLLYRDLNLWERGHEFHANLFVSQVLQGFSTRYVLPGYRDVRSFTDVLLNLQREEVTTYTSRMVALEAGRNRSLGKGRLLTFYLRLQQEDFTVGNQDSSSRLVLPGIRFSEDRYDNVIRPTRGHRYALDLRGTHEALGSEQGLIQLTADASTLIPLPWRFSLFLRGSGGVTALDDPLAELPPSLRFFAGGDQSVRGYSYRSLGPRDAAGKVVGGRHLLVGSAELRRDIFDRFALSAFYDAGNAFNSFDGLSLFQGAGTGIHYYSPVGSVNLYLARQIAVRDPSFHVHFTLGFQL